MTDRPGALTLALGLLSQAKDTARSGQGRRRAGPTGLHEGLGRRPTTSTRLEAGRGRVPAPARADLPAQQPVSGVKDGAIFLWARRGRPARGGGPGLPDPRGDLAPRVHLALDRPVRRRGRLGARPGARRARPGVQARARGPEARPDGRGEAPPDAGAGRRTSPPRTIRGQGLEQRSGSCPGPCSATASRSAVEDGASSRSSWGPTPRSS